PRHRRGAETKTRARHYRLNSSLNPLFIFFKQKTAYDIVMCLEFRRVLFRSAGAASSRWSTARPSSARSRSGPSSSRRSERKSVVEGKSVDLGGRRILTKT